MKRAAMKIVPKLLNFGQKQRRMDIAQEKLTTFNDDPDLLKKVITGDESWVYGSDIETKALSSQWKRPEEPRPKKAHQLRSNVKVLLTVFSIAMAWCIMNSCHKVVRSIKNTTLKLYADYSKQFVRNAQNCGKNQSWILHHDNASADTSMLVREFWPKTKP